MKKTTVVGIAFALLAACGGESEPAAVAAAGPKAVETTAPAAMTTEMTEGLRYHSGGEPFKPNSGAVDVIAPIEGGPWPTVVVFHGDPRVASKGWHRPDAHLIAEQGRVVFLPAWGHFDSYAVSDLGAQRVWEMEKQELSCAVLFAHAHAEEYGGDPDNITLYGLSAGGNAVLMAGLAGFDPLETCAASGGPVQSQALVPIDADWTLGGGWDTMLREQPELFYLATPWRHLDGSQDIVIRVMVPEHVGSYTRSVGSDPATSWLSYRHSDIDLVADLDARGYLADGELSLKESNEYAVEILVEIGYDADLVVMPDATHEVWGEEGTALVVDTVVAAGNR
ncbi:MAG: carboxylesterase family protein [Acidimicrobiia bacterium]|nr:carboxylesterase family protein [Acidimicrobiia bacterium]